MSLHFLTFTFWNYYILKLLRLETITFSDATLSDINVVLSYVLLQYRHIFLPNLQENPLSAYTEYARKDRSFSNIGPMKIFSQK